MRRMRKCWAVIQFNSSHYNVIGFLSPAEERKHLFEHAFRNAEAWQQVSESLEVEKRNNALNELKLKRLSCSKKIEEMNAASQPNTLTEAERAIAGVCASCNSNGCGSLLSSPADNYRQAITNALNCPRYMQFVHRGSKHKGKPGMYFLDNKGVFVVVGSFKKRNPPRCAVISAYRPYPLDKDGAEWTYFDYAKKRISDEIIEGQIRVIGHKGEWGEEVEGAIKGAQTLFEKPEITLFQTLSKEQQEDLKKFKEEVEKLERNLS